MHEPPNPPATPPRESRRDHSLLSGRLRRLVLKELRETLRDRRTIITLVVMPILIYPLLAIVFQRFLITSIAIEKGVSYIVGVDSGASQRILERQLQIGSRELTRREREVPLPELQLGILPDDNFEQHVDTSVVHLAVLRKRESRIDSEAGLQLPTKWELVYRAGSPPSEAALHTVEARLQAYSESQLNDDLRKLGVVVAMPATTTRRPINFSGAPNFSLAALIPLILVLMTVTGAVYPAIDLTAGERERGTLETLIAAPVPRLGLLLAKYVAVLVVSLLTALVNLAGMTITAHSTALAATLFGGHMSFAVVLKVLALLALFAAFFSAILLALTSYARSFKEAQAYIIPLMLLCLVPGVLCLMPGLEFKSWMAVTPLVNIVMLARDVLEGTVNPGLAVAATCSTIFYIAAAIAIAARIFGTDAILYGSQATWSDLVRRPTEAQRAASIPAAMLCLALMFPSYFVLANSLARSQELSMDRRLIVCALITAAVFGGIPIGLAIFGRVRWSTGLGLKRVGLGPLIAAGMLGLVVWPAAHEVFLLSRALGLSMLGEKQFAAAQAMLEQFQTVQLWLILLAMGIVPAVFEELCFRGFLFSSLHSRLNDHWTATTSSVLFGIFHEILFPGRLLTSTFLGFVLGWVRLRTGSVLPGILLHALHNCLLLSLSYYRDELVASGWDVADREHLPLLWHAAATVGVVLAVSLLVATTHRKSNVSA